MRDSDPYDFDKNEIDYDPITERYLLSFDPARVSKISMIVVQLVAAITNTPQNSLPQLHSVVDPGSLDALLAQNSDENDGCKISFTYAQYRITAASEGIIWAQPADDTEGVIDNRLSN